MTDSIWLPMLAQDLNVKVKIVPNRYVAETKFDGHRMILNTDSPFGGFDAWSRTGKDCVKKVGTALAEAIHTCLPKAMLDGELILPEGRSYDVTMLENHEKLVFVVFDVLRYDGMDTMGKTQAVRRAMLEEMFSRFESPKNAQGVPLLQLAQSWPVNSREEIDTLVAKLWEQGDEGVVVKDTHATYSPGKRPKAFFKLKEFQTCEVELVGFEASSGEVFDRGPYAVLVCRDPEGHIVKMKTRDDAMLGDLLTHEYKDVTGVTLVTPLCGPPHPYIGRKLEIGFHQRTDDGNYRHPRIINWRDAE